MKPVLTFPITLESAYMLSPSVKHFVFNASLSPAFTYLPGQFLTVHFDHGDKMLKRSYSIANVPAQNNRIEFAAGFIEGGPGSALLFNLSPGQSININGPFGRLVLPDELTQRTIFVATSTGVTPYRAMIDEIKKRLDKQPDLQFFILQGVQKREDLLYTDEFLALAQAYPQVTFRAQYSRERLSEPLAHEYSGYVQHAFPELNLNPLTDRVYLCGNPGMIDEAFEDLKTRGFTSQQIVREKYISSK